MSFAARVTRHPIPFNPDRGAEALEHMHHLPPELRPLIEGTAGCSPYLAGLIRREGHWLSHALEDAAGGHDHHAFAGGGGPRRGRSRQRVCASSNAAPRSGRAGRSGRGLEPADRHPGLDRFRRCLPCRRASSHVAREARRGKIPGQTEEDARRDGAGMVALAMGKMGAGELNYSSDIDLICLFDETRFDPGDEMEARAGFIRATRRIAATLGETTGEGYVFRTDLRLRPDAGATPVCISMAAAERYYEAEGRSWERSAYIKARPAAGDIAAGERFLETLQPFVWRRHLDFAMVQDTMDMRRRIREHKGLIRTDGEIPLEGHNIKLGAGGIREIEFFAQTRQLVAGGRDPSLRDRRTVKALAALARADWITRAQAGELAELYAHHREVEHRLQMIDDAQTHVLPKSDGRVRPARPVLRGGGHGPLQARGWRRKLGGSRRSPAPSSRRWRPRRPRPRSGRRRRRSSRAGRATRRCGRPAGRRFSNA
jgi:glutamate-ammonia-ligase adenylyltransferase